MWRKIGIGVAVIAVIIIVAAAVAPYFVGGAAESNFKAQIAYLNTRLADRGLRLHVDSYHRGFYGSNADISLTAAPGRMSKARAKVWAILFGSNGVPEFHLHINHGPVPFDAFGYGHWNFMPVLYTAEFQGKGLPALSFVGALKPTVYIIQYFTGSTHTRLAVPPGRFSLGIAGAKWQGGHFAVHLNAARDRSRYKGALKPISFQFMNPKSGMEYSGHFDGLDFAGSARKAQYDFWVGPGHSTFDGLTVKKSGKRIVELASAHEQGKTGMENGRWLNATGQLNQKGGTIFDWHWTGLTLNGTLSHIDAAAWRRTITRMRAAIRNTERSGSAQLDKGTAKAILADFPRIFASSRADYKLSMTASDGNLNVVARAKFDTVAPAAGTVASPLLQLLKRADVSTRIDFDRKFADGVGVKLFQAPSAASIGEALQLGMSKDYLQEKDGHYSTSIVYRRGVLTVNGKPVHTPALAPQTVTPPATASNAQSAPVPAPATGR